MTDVKIFSIDGKTYPDVPVIDFNLFGEILDGEGTGRTQAKGWPMKRQPQGVIKNVELKLGVLSSKNKDFIALLAVLDSFGKIDFRTVSFITPSGTITQKMYASSYKLPAKRFTHEGITYWSDLTIKFIAKKAIDT